MAPPTLASVMLDTPVRIYYSQLPFSQRLIIFRIISGSTCDVRDPCVPNPCKNSGVCVISNGVQTCDCPSTYTGNRCETPRQTCGGVSRNPLGHLEFPIGGNVYQHGLSCAWVLVTNSSLVLNVTFTRFNLEHSTDCKYDFLQVSRRSIYISIYFRHILLVSSIKPLIG